MKLKSFLFTMLAVLGGIFALFAGDPVALLATAPILFTPDEERGDYVRLTNVLAQQMNLSVADFSAKYKIMPFFLKMAVYLNNGTNTYTLSPRKGVDTPVPTSNLLDQNDFFALTSIGVRIGRAAYAAASNTYSNHGNYPQLTYADPNYFTGNGSAAGSESASLQTLVNGLLTVSVAGDSVIENLSVQELMYNGDSGFSAVANNLRNPSFGGSSSESRGLLRTTPNFVLDAMADNQFVISLAPGAKANIDGGISTATTDSGVRNILYLVAGGYKVKNLSGGGLSCPVRA